ncbi:hypothetical protein [Clostridium scatologenes]|uniref:rRNA biogenesis protein rrp5, putative n=1 Tax=Clostridium scatologenes TaxID=1548 RepID=A0A0E3M8Z2_CLOSL|nr:hypothetical protein [Clostridium scatologenes]AKA72315.1 rRNA biogenesis protein rrp5, putative [Clostridium scatologenes]
MDINIRVRVDCPDIMNSLLALAESISQIKAEGQVREETKVVKEKHEVKPKEVQAPKEKVKEEKSKTVTLEEVRGLLAELSQNGKQQEVKALIKKFGGRKLTDIPQEKYSELLKEAEVI